MSTFPVFNYETIHSADSSLKALPLLSMNLLGSAQSPCYQLAVHGDTISTLESQFDPKSDLIILVVSGLAGLGKSTWLNTLALSLDPDLHSDPFPTGEEQFSITKGLMVYPKPLKLFQDQQSPQIMLCDMEGFDGLRKDVSNEVNKNLLKRTVFCGLMLSSRFCVHSNVRLQPSQIESLNDIYGMASELQTMFRLEKPQIALLIGNTNSIANEQELKTQIRTQCNVSEDLYATLKVFPRGQLPEKFQEHRRTRDLLGSSYHENALRFLLSSLAYPKSRHGFNTRFRISDFTQLISSLQEAVNEENFMRRYLSSIKTSLEQMIRPKMEQHQAAFEESIQTILHAKGISEDCDALRVSLKQAKKRAWEQLINEIEGEFHVEVGSIPEIMKVLKNFEEKLEKRIVMLLVPLTEEEVKVVSPQRYSPPSEPFADSRFKCQSQPIPSFEDRLTASELPATTHTALFVSNSFPGPKKKDGTPDMRYKVNKDLMQQRSVPDECTDDRLFLQDGLRKEDMKKGVQIPLKKDGTPDMRFSINKHLKKDGKPDMRFLANKTSK